MAEKLEQMIYQMIKDVEGYNGYIYYDKRGIPTFGAGVALIYYNKTTGTYSARQTVGNVTMEQFLTLITGSSTTAEIIKNLIDNDLEYLQTKEGSLTGEDEYKQYISNYSENNFIENIWNGNVSVYDQYINSVKNSLGNTLFNQLTDVQKAVMFSLNYADLIGNNLKVALSHYISSDTEESFIGKMSVWYEILYQSNNNSTVSDRPGQQNRRFMEANSFVKGELVSKPNASTASSTFPVSNYDEANLAIAFMNCKAEEMLAFYKSGNFREYTNRNYEIVRNHFSSAVSVFLSNQNYHGNYKIETLFTDWNLYTDLQIDLNSNGRPDGTTSYGDITGSDKKDLIFITGNQNGTTVHAGAGDDFVGGSSNNDVVYSGSGKDVIYTYGGDDQVYTTDGKSSDYNTVYLGAGSDTFHGGDGDDFVDGGSGAIGSHVSSNIEATDSEKDINRIDLGGGHNRYTGTQGKDIVSGTGYNTVYLGAGSDEYTGGNDVDVVDGGSVGSGYGSDGVLDVNTIYLGGGNDRYKGGNGKDVVHGGANNDIINGGNGQNELYGDAGDDAISGGNHNDKIYGGTGRDTIDAGFGNNIIDVGNDDDYDYVHIYNNAGAVDHIYNARVNDNVYVYGTNNIYTQGKDLIIESYRGNKAIIHNRGEDEPDPENPEYPKIMDENGNLWLPNDDGVWEPHPYGDPLNRPGLDTEELKEIVEQDKFDPIVVDLNGNGIEMLPANGNYFFDLNGDNIGEEIDWVASTDGFLVHDSNNNGQVDGIDELFGNATIDGFEELSSFDTNGDGKVNSEDENFSQIKVWQDLNGNNVSDDGELKSLEELGISEFVLTGRGQETNVHNSIVQKIGHIVKTDGTTADMADIFFQTNTNANTWTGDPIEISEDVAAMPYINGMGMLPNLHIAAMLDENLKNILSEINELSLQNADQFLQKTTALIERWCEADTIPDTEMAGMLSKKNVTILSKISGFSTLTNVRLTTTAQKLQQLYINFYNSVVQNLLVQTYFSKFDNYTGFIAKDTGAILATPVEDFAALMNEVKQINIENNPLLTYNVFQVINEINKFHPIDDVTFSAGITSWLQDTSMVNMTAGLINDSYKVISGSITDASGENSYIIYGTEGIENIVLGNTNNFIETNNGNDSITVGNGNNIINAGDGYDYIAVGNGDNTIISTSGSINITAGDGDNNINIGTGSAYATIGNGDNTIISTSGSVSITAGDGDNNILAAEGNDIITVGNGNNYIDTGAGNDVITAGAGDDVIIAGAGNDSIYGGAGANVYKFEAGFGIDTLSNFEGNDAPMESLNKADIIEFGEGINPSDVQMNRDYLDLILTVGNDKLTICKYFAEAGESSYTVNEIKFADGTVWTYDQIRVMWNAAGDSSKGLIVTGDNDNNSLSGSSGSDVIYGKNGNDTIDAGSGNDIVSGGKGNDTIHLGAGDDHLFYNLGDGFDTITDYGNNDTIFFGPGIAFSDLKFAYVDGDLRIIIKDNPNQGLLIKNFFSSDLRYKIEEMVFNDGSQYHLSDMGLTLTQDSHGETIGDTPFSDIIYANDGFDTVNAGDGNDIIIGGRGNDTLSGGKGDDTYIWNLGDGLDTIYDYESSTSTGRNDKIKFGEGISPEDVKLRQEDYNLHIIVNDDCTQGMIIKDFFSNDYYKVEKMEFADGTVIDITQSITLFQSGASETINATNGNDVIYGLGGNDNISAGNGNDVIIGGKGNDTLNGGSGNDTYLWNLGDGFDTITDYENSSSTGRNDKIKFGEGISPEDVTFRHVDYDLIINVNGDSSQGMLIKDFFANDYYKVEYVEFADGTSFKITDGVTFKYTDLDETVGATDGNDIIYGMGGDDIIYASDGSDIIIGGKGNDTLNGGYGNDTYVWNLGDGFDTIYDYENSSSTGRNDKIKFGEGISPEDITFRHVGYDLIINVNGDSSQGMLIKDFFANDYYKVEYVEFADGTSFKITDGVTFKYTDLGETVGATDGNDVIYGMGGDDDISAGNGDDIIIGGNGNDVINGGNGNDTYIWNLGDGFDTITDYENSSSTGRNDKIKFGEGISPEDITFRHVGYDLIINVNGDSSQGMLIKDFFANDYYKVEYIEFADGTSFKITDGVTFEYTDLGETVGATDGNDVIYGLGGNDNISAGNGNDVIIGGKGNDTLNGGNGNDTYVWNLGDGFDTIYDYENSSSTGRNDKIKFGEGISFDDLSFYRSGYDLIINVNADFTQGMSIKDFFANDYYKIEYIEFANGDILNLKTDITANTTLPHQTITGTINDETLTGGIGNDTINGNDGSDIITGNQGNDILNGGSDDDVYIWNLGDGFDTITDEHGEFDIISFGENIAYENLTFSRVGDDLHINVNANSNQGMKIVDFYKSDANKIEYLEFSDGSLYDIATSSLVWSLSNGDDTVSGTDYDDTIYGNGGNDTINAGNGDDTLIGGTGDDILNGGADNDTYVYNLGDGLDTITDTQGVADKIKFGTGIASSDVAFRQNGSDLQIFVNAALTEGMIVKDFYKSGGANQIEFIEFADGSKLNISAMGLTLSQSSGDDVVTGTDYEDIVYGNSGNDTINTGNGDDTLIGGTGNDILNGGNGNDTYVWNLGDGLDTVTDGQGTSDKILFGTGISLNNLKFTQEGKNLRIYVNDDVAQGLVIVNFYNSNADKIEKLEFADGSIFNLSTQGLTLTQPNGDNVVNGTVYADVVYGNDGVDTISTGNGHDTLVGGKGNDILDGGRGNDTYVWNLGDGMDTITDANGNDKIVFGAGISEADVQFAREGNNLRITIKDDFNQGMLIKNFFSSTANKVELIEFAHGETLDISQGLTLTQTNGSETINGTGLGDVIYGMDGNDTISASGNNTFIGGKGNDIISGGTGNDTYIYNLGDGFDTITESGGNDKIVFGEGISQSDLSFEQIGNHLKISINDDEIKGIQINNQFSSASNKVETIEFADGSTMDISNADQLIQAMNSFSVSNSASTDTLSNPTQDVSDMYSLAANSDLTRKAI